MCYHATLNHELSYQNYVTYKNVTISIYLALIIKSLGEISSEILMITFFYEMFFHVKDA